MTQVLEKGQELVEGYKLMRRLGKGGFGEVWEVETHSRFLVAMK